MCPPKFIQMYIIYYVYNSNLFLIVWCIKKLKNFKINDAFLQILLYNVKYVKKM